MFLLKNLKLLITLLLLTSPLIPSTVGFKATFDHFPADQISYHIGEVDKLSDTLIDQYDLYDLKQTLASVEKLINEDRLIVDKLTDHVTKDGLLFKAQLKYEQDLLRGELLVRFLLLIPRIERVRYIWSELSKSENLISDSRKTIENLEKTYDQLLSKAEQIRTQLLQFRQPISDSDEDFTKKLVQLDSIHHELQILEIRFSRARATIVELHFQIGNEKMNIESVQVTLINEIGVTGVQAIGGGVAIYAFGTTLAMSNPITAGALGAYVVTNLVISGYNTYQYSISKERIRELAQLMNELRPYDFIGLEIECTIKNAKAHIKYNWDRLHGKKDAILEPTVCETVPNK